MGKIAWKRGTPVEQTAEGIASLGYKVVQRGDQQRVALSPFVMDDDAYQTDYSHESPRGIAGIQADDRLEELRALAIQSGLTRDMVTDPSFERRLFTFTGSDESVDRYGSRLLIDGTFNGKKYGTGWDLAPFRRNPVIMPFHQYETFPVGRALDVWVDKKAGAKRLRFQVLFGDGSATPLAPMFVNAYATREMRSVSVGWWPHKIHVPQTDDEASLLGLRPPVGVLFATNELWELSPVSIPGNPNALADGIDDDILPEERDCYLRLAEQADSLLPAYSAQIRSALNYEAKATVVVPATQITPPDPSQEGVGGDSDDIEGGDEDLLQRGLDALSDQLRGALAQPPSSNAGSGTEPPPAPVPGEAPAPEPEPVTEPEPEPVFNASPLENQIRGIVADAVAPISSSLSQVLASLEAVSARLEAIGTSTHRGAPPKDPLYDEVLRVAEEAINLTRKAKAERN